MPRRKITKFPLELSALEHSADRAGLTDAERYAYLRILYAMFDEPETFYTESRIRSLSKIGHSAWYRFRPKLFQLLHNDGDQFYHPRVRRELEHAKEIRRKRSKAGQRGNAARWNGDGRKCDKPDDRNSDREGSQTGRKTIALKNSIYLPTSNNPDFFSSPPPDPSTIEPDLSTAAEPDPREGEVLQRDDRLKVDRQGLWGDPDNRAAYATQKLVEFIPGDKADAWAVVLAAEDPSSPEHFEACQTCRKAAIKAGVGWFPPETRGNKR